MSALSVTETGWRGLLHDAIFFAHCILCFNGLSHLNALLQAERALGKSH